MQTWHLDTTNDDNNPRFQMSLHKLPADSRRIQWAINLAYLTPELTWPKPQTLQVQPPALLIFP